GLHSTIPRSVQMAETRARNTLDLKQHQDKLTQRHWPVFLPSLPQLRWRSAVPRSSAPVPRSGLRRPSLEALQDAWERLISNRRTATFSIDAVDAEGFLWRSGRLPARLRTSSWAKARNSAAREFSRSPRRCCSPASPMSAATRERRSPT